MSKIMSHVLLILKVFVYLFVILRILTTLLNLAFSSDSVALQLFKLMIRKIIYSVFKIMLYWQVCTITNLYPIMYFCATPSIYINIIGYRHKIFGKLKKCRIATSKTT